MWCVPECLVCICLYFIRERLEQLLNILDKHKIIVFYELLEWFNNCVNFCGNAEYFILTYYSQNCSALRVSIMQWTEIMFTIIYYFQSGLAFTSKI